METPCGRTSAPKRGIPGGLRTQAPCPADTEAHRPLGGTAWEGCAWGAGGLDPERSVRSHHRPDLDLRLLRMLVSGEVEAACLQRARAFENPFGSGPQDPLPILRQGLSVRTDRWASLRKWPCS